MVHAVCMDHTLRKTQPHQQPLLINLNVSDLWGTYKSLKFLNFLWFAVDKINHKTSELKAPVSHWDFCLGIRKLHGHVLCSKKLFEIAYKIRMDKSMVDSIR